MRGPVSTVQGYKLSSDQAERYSPGRYRVTIAFRDRDGGEHSVGEEWSLKEVLFVPYDGELLLIVALDDRPDFYVIPLTSSDPAQEQVIDNFSKYAATIN